MTNDSVRLAWPKEAETISSIQRRGWVQRFPKILTDELTGSINLAQMTDAWQAAIISPSLAQQRVLVANRGNLITGFTVTGPDADEPETGTIAEFWIDPPQQRRGHGSRLMQAAVDTLRADGFRVATWWITTTDDITRAFAESAGWQADGANRNLALRDDLTLKEIRLSVGI